MPNCWEGLQCLVIQLCCHIFGLNILAEKGLVLRIELRFLDVGMSNGGHLSVCSGESISRIDFGLVSGENQ